MPTTTHPHTTSAPLFMLLAWALWHGLVLHHHMDLSTYRIAICHTDQLTKVAPL